MNNPSEIEAGQRFNDIDIFENEAAPPPLLLPDTDNLKYHLHLEHIFSLIDRLLRKTAPIKILELGCGGGVNLYPVKKRYGDKVDLFGVDISDTAIAYAKKLNIGEFKQGSADELCFSESFDLVFISDVLEHLPSLNNVTKTLEIVRSCLKDSGYFYLLCPIEANAFSLYWWFSKTGILSNHSKRFNGHHIQFTNEQLKEILENYFSIEESQYSNHFFSQVSVFLFFVLKREILSLIGGGVARKLRDSNLVLNQNGFLLFLRKVFLFMIKPLSIVSYYESQLRKHDKFAAGTFHGFLTKK